MDQPIGLGFIGCGKHAMRSHVVVAAGMPEFSVKAAFDLNPTAAQRIQQIAPQAYLAKSAADLISRPEIEAVIIATRPDSHLELTKQALEGGKHVLCEKPLWMKEDGDGVAMLLETVNRGLVLTSCHPRRFEECYRLVRARMHDYQGLYGGLQEFRFDFLYHNPETVKAPSLLLDHMNHEIDLANFLLGYSQVRLIRRTDGSDRYRVTGERKNGVRLSFSGERTLPIREYRNTLKLLFYKGQVLVESVLRDGVTTSRVIREGLGSRSRTIELETSEPYEAGFGRVMKNFADTVRGEDTNYLTLRDMIINTIVCTHLVATGQFSN